MRILIDTNILIPIEPGSHGDLEANTPLGLELVRLCNLGGHKILIHSLMMNDIQRDKNTIRADLRRSLVERYHKLETVIPIPPEWNAVVGNPTEGENDWVDNHLLAAVHSDSVHILVTEDIRIRKKARRLALNDRVWSLSKILETLRVLSDQPIGLIPSLEQVKAFTLSDADPIFRSLRADYGVDGFNAWLAKAKRDGRDALVIWPGLNERLIAGLAILKQEDSVPGGRQGKTLKLCTFKVGENYGQNRYGELLLKGVFDYCRKNRYEQVYFTAFEKQVELLGFSESFGFKLAGVRTGLGELIVYKDFIPSGNDNDGMDPWNFHVNYGPWAAKLSTATAFIIPIQPKYFELLFPEAVAQQSLIAPKPCGNGIKKAYLCHAQIKRISRGDSLYFYQSSGGKTSGILAIGIAEDVMRSNDPDAITRFVGNRTVYTHAQIATLCGKEVLAIRFRRVFLLQGPVSLKMLVDSGVIRGAPQSIAQVPVLKTAEMSSLCNQQ